MTDNSKFEAPSGSRSETSEGDLDWEEAMLEKIELLTAEFHKLRDMYHESQREVILLQFELSLATQTDQMGESDKTLTRVGPRYPKSEEWDRAELKKFVQFLFTKQHDDKKRAADAEGKKE